MTRLVPPIEKVVPAGFQEMDYLIDLGQEDPDSAPKVLVGPGANCSYSCP